MPQGSARPMPAARPGARPGARPAARATATHAGGEVTTGQMAQLVIQGTLIGVLILGVLGVITVFFGDALRARFLPIAAGPAAGGSATPGPGPTVYYRDRGDGTVMVMEIDGNGTRLKGVVNRVDVPLLQADKVREGWGDNTSSPHSRVNALGSSFR
jgi:hypothetical protein